MKGFLTIRNRLGPAWVTRRVVVHQIQVNLGHDGIQLRTSLSIAGEELIHHALSSNQIMTAEQSICERQPLAQQSQTQVKKLTGRTAGTLASAA